MPNFLPDLVLDENHSTGWAKVRIFGDTEYGCALIPAARSVLGNMKAVYGVNAAQAEGSAGGFFHSWRTLPDGSRVHAITNDGHDMLDIYPLRPAAEKSQPKKRPDDFDPGLYLWVGIRATGSYQEYNISSYLVEPLLDGKNRGCINQAFGMSGWVWDPNVTATGNDTDGWTFANDGVSFGYEPDTDGDAMLRNFHKQWATDWTDGGGLGHHGLQNGEKTLEQHNFAFDITNGATSDYGTVFFSRNGLMMTDFTNSAQDWFGPRDPRASDSDNAGATRDFSGRIGSSYSHHLWDTVYWIDPYDYKKVGDSDDRPALLALTKFMRDNGYIESGRAQVLPGTYQLIVQCYDTPPSVRSSRTGQTIPDFSSYGRSDSCDYSDYDTNTGGQPLSLEVEVRIGKTLITQRDGIPDPAEVPVHLPGLTFNFTLTCDSSDDRNCVNTPLGWSTAHYDSCGGDGGLNMTRGPSLSRMIEIDVLGKTATLSDALPTPFIGNAGYYHPPVNQKRYPVRVYVYGGVFPAVDPSDFANFGGHAVWVAREAMTSGVYGCCDMREWSEAHLKSALAGADPTHVYRLEESAGTFTDMGTWSGAPYGYTNPPDDPNFDWFYPYAVADHNDCFNTMGVVVISTGDAFYEGSQNYFGWPGHNDSVDCCT